MVVCCIASNVYHIDLKSAESSRLVVYCVGTIGGYASETGRGCGDTTDGVLHGDRAPYGTESDLIIVVTR